MELARRHMRRVLGPDTPAAAVDAAAREMFASYGRYWAETFWYRPRRRDEVLAVTRVENLDLVVRLRDEGRPMVFALPHVGNFDAAGAIAQDLGLRLVAVAERLSNPRISDWFVEARRTLGIEVVLTGGAGTTRRLLRVLADGAVVALPADRDVTGRGVEVEFFGEVTRLPAGPAALADRTGAALLTVGTFFGEDGYDMVVHEEVALPTGGDRASRVLEGTRRVARSLEEIVRLHPTQWHLLQPNWPSDPGWEERS